MLILKISKDHLILTLRNKNISIKKKILVNFIKIILTLRFKI
jgi:hypothetical protein